MAFTSTLSLYSHPQVRLRHQRLQSLALTAAGVAQFAPLPALSGRRTRSQRVRFGSVVVRASSSVEGTRARATGSRRVYRQSQANAPLSSAPVKQIANFVAPFAAFFALTLLTVIWKLVEKLLVPNPKQLKSSTVESQPPSQGLKWSFAAGTNLLSQLGAKIERQSKQKLNEFARELRSFPSIDMSGRNFGDEGLFFLAESLAFNQTAEEVSFAANGITAAGLRAFDGVLQSNITLKTLDLSGNLVGDEGAKCLCDILVNNSSIEKLQLNSADLGDEGAKAIAEMLKKNSCLRVLELNNNMIEYSGFSSLAGALLENNSIRNIHLNGNYGGALGANALAKALESNKSLRELHLHGNSIGDEGIRSLMTGLSSHKGKLTLLDIGNNSLTAKLQSALADARDHVLEMTEKEINIFL
ncbi:NLRC3 protein [Spatholobus suberectus]|nr:NLRC3 protein [Spatholobus suberectus]